MSDSRIYEELGKISGILEGMDGRLGRIDNHLETLNGKVLKHEVSIAGLEKDAKSRKESRSLWKSEAVKIGGQIAIAVLTTLGILKIK